MTVTTAGRIHRIPMTDCRHGDHYRKYFTYHDYKSASLGIGEGWAS